MNTTDLGETLPHVYTVPESMAALRCSKPTLYRLIRKKRLPATKVGGRLLVPKAALIKLLTPTEKKL